MAVKTDRWQSDYRAAKPASESKPCRSWHGFTGSRLAVSRLLGNGQNPRRPKLAQAKTGAKFAI
jgi:hypothetical protein